MDEIPGLGMIVSFLVSGTGFVFFSYGRKMSRPPQILFGLIMMVFPYFVGGVLAMLSLFAALNLAIWFATKMGW